MSPTPSPIPVAPPPWLLKGTTIYSFMLYISPSHANSLDKSFIYSPLEANSSFSDGKHVGGLGMVQVIRYPDSPVGAYDELLLVPGNVEYEKELVGKDGNKTMEKGKNLRLTRIYVSRKETSWNGRKNWNIPKHLARFEFKDLPGNTTSIAVYPHDTENSIDESSPSTAPFFTATYKPISYLPNFPISTSIAKYVGMDLTILQPPLPEGKGAFGELPGTEKWCEVLPLEYSSKTSLGWWDLKQVGNEATERDALLADRDRERGGKGGGGYENWWPGIGRWRIGVKMEDATIDFQAGERWEQE